MEIVQELTLQEKLHILADAAKYDVACTSSGVQRSGKQGFLGNSAACGICHSFASDGRCISLLKILLTNHCIYDCKYCINRSSNDVVRTTFTPREVCELTIEFYKRNYIEGLFLSSGVMRNPAYTMERICESLYLLRNEYHFNGYIHVKAIPGAPDELLAEAGYLADRMSVNLELPTGEGLRQLAPNKTHRAILRPMRMMTDTIAGHRLAIGKDARMERSSSMRGLTHSIFSQSELVAASPAADALSEDMRPSVFDSSGIGMKESGMDVSKSGTGLCTDAKRTGEGSTASGTFGSGGGPHIGASGILGYDGGSETAASGRLWSGSCPGASYGEYTPDRTQPGNMQGNGPSAALHILERPSALRRMDWQRPFAPAGQSTQMIIGATPETDYHLLKTTQHLYQTYDLKRVFYSAYVPINEDSALPALDTPPPLLREHRLYQADWLLRFYGFQADELLSAERPDFNELIDPKCDWALRHLDLFPVEINTVPYDMLLRIPGVGPKSARRIAQARRHSTLDFSHLKKIGVVLKRAHYFITCSGRMMYRIPIEEQYITRQLIGTNRRENWQVNHQERYEQMSVFEFMTS